MSDKPTILQSTINNLNDLLIKLEKEFDWDTCHMITLAKGYRHGCIDAYWDKKCYDKDDIKREIIEFTKIILRQENILIKMNYKDTVLPDLETQLKAELKNNNDLKKIFNS